MKKHHNSLTLTRAICFIAVISILVLQIVPISNTSAAAQITDRTMTLVGEGTTGGSTPDAVVNHKFEFTVPTTADVGSIKFLYCTVPGAPTDSCTTPIGADASSATLFSQSGNGATPFTMVASAGSPYLTRTAEEIAADTVLTFQFNSVHNPTATNKTFFVRITTYESTDTTGTAIDAGTVAASTATQLIITGVMPESLVFCTGETIQFTGGVPDCSKATNGSINFNQLFSPTDTATAESEMSASTNASSGYAVTVFGPTLTSGGNTISAIDTLGVGFHGVSQFGINLKLNTTDTSTVPVGAEVSLASNGTNFRGQAIGDYDTVDQFKYVSGETIADSGYDGLGGDVPAGTDAQVFTVSYIVNVPGSQPAGVYSTTLTYICTATF